MRALLQRVSKAGVRLPDGEARTIGRGLLIYLGVGREDSPETALKLAKKVATLRIFPNAEGKFDRSVLDERGQILLISQFTLYANPKGSRRPDFTAAAEAGTAKVLYEKLAEILRAKGILVKIGSFGEHMEINSVNDGPVTIWLDTQLF
jgi:D-tyrosyl-tRNA(Tyr) deacylase